MSYLRTEITDGVAVVTLNDPDRRNALNLDMNDEILAAMDEIEADESVGAVVVTGEPPGVLRRRRPLPARRVAGRRAQEDLRGLPPLRRAAPSPPSRRSTAPRSVQGSNLALVCDVRIAAERARFDTRFLQLGLHPGGGHTWMFRRIAGPQATMAAVLLGEVIDGREAERVGLVHRCVADDDLLAHGDRHGRKAAEAPRELVMKIKATIRDMADIDDHAEAVDRELEPQVWSLNQPAFKERLAALQKKISSKG